MFGDYFISTRLINVATAEIANSHNEEGAKLSNSADVISITQKIASILSDMTILEQHLEIQSNLQLEKERRALELEKSMQFPGRTFYDQIRLAHSQRIFLRCFDNA